MFEVTLDALPHTWNFVWGPIGGATGSQTISLFPFQLLLLMLLNARFLCWDYWRHLHALSLAGGVLLLGVGLKFLLFHFVRVTWTRPLQCQIESTGRSVTRAVVFRIRRGIRFLSKYRSKLRNSTNKIKKTGVNFMRVTWCDHFHWTVPFSDYFSFHLPLQTTDKFLPQP